MKVFALLSFFSYFNPPTPCGVGLHGANDPIRILTISIHPPRAGWDAAADGVPVSGALISIHPPRAGWDRQHETFPRQS